MKSNTTAIWLVIAAMLAAFIWFYQNHLQPASPPPLVLVSGLRPLDVTAVDIYPDGSPALSATLTNGDWQLEKPFAYPAQAAAIQALLDALVKVKPVMRFSASEMSAHKDADAEFGFDNPQYSIVITAGGEQWQLRVGNKTAPGDGVYVRVVGLDGAFVTGTDWLQFLPHSATDWRDTSLVTASGDVDWITITNGTKVIQLQRDVTNRLWRMTYPLQARADNLAIVSALQQLRSTHISKFVTDDPKADPSVYGLQPPDLDLRLGSGANVTAVIQAGKPATDDPAQIYARCKNTNSIVSIPGQALTPWRGTVNQFRDPHLVDLTAPVAQIEVQGENHFTLRLQGSNDWTLAGEKMPVDAELAADFIRRLAGLRVAEFEKDVVTAKDLQDFGLAPPARMDQITLSAADTNNIIAQLAFGAVDTNRDLIYVKRADEGFVYAMTAQDLKALPQAGWELRDRRIWNFSETNVAQLTLRENHQTRVLFRTGDNAWSLAPGSQGIIDPLAVEETVHRLSGLTAVGWVANNLSDPEKFGFSTNNLSMAIDLKTGERFSLDFGLEIPRAQTALAAVNLDGSRWTFVFPPTVYQLVAAYLTIPPPATH